jgi:hypothetical protein
MGRFNETARTIPARFNSVGTKITGKVLSVGDAPVPVFEGGRPVAAKTDLVGTLEVQTDVVLDVNGTRTLMHTRGGISYAIAAELQRIHADDLNVGDVLTVEYTGDEDMGEDLTPAKVFKATIKPGK